jgi:hypothetical protein
VPGHRLQRGNADGGFFRSPGKSLDGGYADADPRERAGAVCHGENIHVGNRRFGISEKIFCHRKKGPAVRESGGLRVLAEQCPVPAEGDGR